jgi:hypothetical protein
MLRAEFATRIERMGKAATSRQLTRIFINHVQLHGVREYSRAAPGSSAQEKSEDPVGPCKVLRWRLGGGPVTPSS